MITIITANERRSHIGKCSPGRERLAREFDVLITVISENLVVNVKDLPKFEETLYISKLKNSRSLVCC